MAQTTIKESNPLYEIQSFRFSNGIYCLVGSLRDINGNPTGTVFSMHHSDVKSVFSTANISQKKLITLHHYED